MIVSIDPLTGMPRFEEDSNVRVYSRSGSGISRVPDISSGTTVPTNGIDTPSHQYYDTATSTYYIYVMGVWYPITGATPPASGGTDIPMGLLFMSNLR